MKLPGYGTEQSLDLYLVLMPHLGHEFRATAKLEEIWYSSWYWYRHVIVDAIKLPDII